LSNHGGNRFDLPEGRLATTDVDGKRLYLYPAEVHGRFHTLRQFVHPVLMLIFIVLPWIRVSGRPLVRIDLEHFRFTLFGSTFWAHDVPMMLFVVGLFTLTIAFVTAVWGRVWCGWACPQTVFIEAVFRRIERWVEGNSHARRKADSEPRTVKWVTRKAVKWLLFLGIALILSHTLLTYFVGTETMLTMIRRRPSEAPGWFLFVSFVTAILLFDFGWFREQFCVIVCPYGRLQSLFLDEDSKVILYDKKRGEPRKGEAPADGKAGDCVNCYRCVQVCPTGIDIRRGNQLECIACTACVDACDEVMDKIHRPRGLIRIDSESSLTGRSRSFFRFNVVAYLTGLAIIAFGVAWAANHRESIDVEILRSKDAPYQEIAGEIPTLLNHFHAEINNESDEIYKVTLAFEPGTDPEIRILSGTNPIDIKPGTKARVEFFVQFPLRVMTDGRLNVSLTWSATTANSAEPLRGKEALRLVGPLR